MDQGDGQHTCSNTVRCNRPADALGALSRLCRAQIQKAPAAMASSICPLQISSATDLRPSRVRAASSR